MVVFCCSKFMTRKGHSQWGTLVPIAVGTCVPI